MLRRRIINSLPITQSVNRICKNNFPNTKLIFQVHHMFFSNVPIIDQSNNAVVNKDNKTKVNKDKTKKSLTSRVTSGIISAGHYTVDLIKNPKRTWESIKAEAHHLWLGSKLLWVETKVASNILSRLLQGHGMSRRERMQLTRTSVDLFRLVPFSVFILVPFMELFLPIALKLFPNMLPSTFQDDYKKEENMKRELQMRLAVAGFMQETLQSMATSRKGGKKGTGDKDAGGQEVLDFLEKARLGEPLSNENVISIAKLFQDELTLPNISRPQLVSMCQYMGLISSGADAFLRFQLRTKFRSIKEDDRRILWEGIDSLTTHELREACQERGMRSVGLTSFGYKRNLKEWLDLSIQKHIPISLLIISRAIALSSTSAHPEDVLKSSMQALDQGIINEVVLAAASQSEKNTLDMKARKLESIQFQKERIDEERVKTDTKPDQKTEPEVYKEAKEVVDPTPIEVGYNIMPAEEIVFTPESVASTIKDLEITGSREVTTTNISKSDDVLKPVIDSVNIDKVPPILVDEKKDDKKDEKKLEKISLSELEAISDLTRESSVEREKAELAILEASMDSVKIESKEKKIKVSKPEIEIPTPVKDVNISQVEEKLIDKKPLDNVISSSTDSKKIIEPVKAEVVIEEEEEIEDEDSDQTNDKSIANMKHVLGNMLDKLKVKIDTTDKELGKKMHLLDLDNDGELSADELKEAFTKILKRLPNEDEIKDMIDSIDLDKDGKVTVLELLQYVESRKKIDEFQKLEEQKSKEDNVKEIPIPKK